jgi:hypothetical protein
VTDHPVSTAAAPVEKKRNILQLFLGIVVRPRSTLAYLRDAGGASWIWPALLAVVIVIVTTIAIAPITARIAQEQMDQVLEQQGEDLSPLEQQQIEQAAQFATNPVFIIVFPAITGVIAMAVGWLIRGGALYLFSLLLGGHSGFGAMFRMAVWTTLPDSVRQVVTSIGTVMAGRVLSSGLAGLVQTPETGAAIPIPSSTGAVLWQTFLGGIDIYWLWAMILTVIGVAVTAHLSWRKGLVVTVAYWLLTVLVSLGLVWAGLALSAQVMGGG